MIDIGPQSCTVVSTASARRTLHCVNGVQVVGACLIDAVRDFGMRLNRGGIHYPGSARTVASQPVRIGPPALHVTDPVSTVHSKREISKMVEECPDGVILHRIVEFYDELGMKASQRQLCPFQDQALCAFDINLHEIGRSIPALENAVVDRRVVGTV